jgi:hypothetical protein
MKIINKHKKAAVKFDKRILGEILKKIHVTQVR